MCLVEKCFLFLPLYFSCLLLGGFTFVLSLAMGVVSVALLVHPDDGVIFLKEIISLEMNSSFLKIIFSFVTVMDVMWMVFSINLVYGILKNRANFVLSYFFFGISVTILVMLSGLLVLLQSHWVMMIVEIIAGLIYTHCLIVVYSAYELMQRGKVFSLNSHRRSDGNLLIVT